MEWVRYIVEILSGLAVVIPLVVKLVEYVRRAAEERNWNQIVSLVLEYMKTAEGIFDEGKARKEYVMDAVVASAKGIDYELDDVALAKISDMIDSICDAAKVINVKVSSDTDSV
ncbi:MAG: hypothetical protein ACI3XJ_12755 [Oscillospiraceae bacterium]